MEINIENITVVFSGEQGPLKAIDDFSLRIDKNRFISLVGKSGCGKSTLLNVIGGFIKPKVGNVFINEDKKPELGISKVLIFQEDSVFPWLDIKNNIAYGLKAANCEEAYINKIVDKYLQETGLESFKHYFPKDLSGGMRKRVDLARAYAINPPIILMDEPFGSLDSHTRLQMQVLLLKLWETDRKTILFVTHDIEEAVFLSDEIIVMENGFLKKSFDITFARPRINNIKYDKKFIELRKKIEEAIGN